MIPAEVLRLAEHPMAEGAVWRSCEVVVRDEFVLWFGPSYYPGLVVVQRLRSAPIDEVRSLLRDRGLSRAIWQIGPSTPPGVEEALRGRGFVPELTYGLVVLRHEPMGVVEDVEVRPVESFEDFVSFLRVQRAAFDDDADLAGVKAAYELERDDAALTTYLAYVDGVAVACGRATFTPCAVALNGGGTVPDARGRGAYRAIVGARWRDAIARGTPYLVTSARRETSYPILMRMGFEEVGELRMLVDEGF